MFEEGFCLNSHEKQNKNEWKAKAKLLWHCECGWSSFGRLVGVTRKQLNPFRWVPLSVALIIFFLKVGVWSCPFCFLYFPKFLENCFCFYSQRKCPSRRVCMLGDDILFLFVGHFVYSIVRKSDALWRGSWGQWSLPMCCVETWLYYVAQLAVNSQCSPGQTSDLQSSWPRVPRADMTDVCHMHDSTPSSLWHFSFTRTQFGNPHLFFMG